MALSSTVHQFEIDLSDADRSVYETLALRVARHPSESAEYLVTRVLAYCLEYTEGIAFSSGGLSDPDEPAILVRDLTGTLQAWIEVGTPDVARLHKAAKLAPRVAVYLHKDPERWLRQFEGAKVHRAAEIAVHAVDRALVAALVAALDRRMAFGLSVTDGEVLIAFDRSTISGPVTPLRLPAL